MVHLGIPRVINFAKITLTITLFNLSGNLNCNHFGADSRKNIGFGSRQKIGKN